MPQRLLVFLFILVAVRSLVFVIWGYAHFDADQAILGLMAYDISRLHGLVLFFYGQKYLLGLLDWLAAPLFVFFGPSIAALKLPLVGINLAVVFLIFRNLVREARLKPLSAMLCALLFAFPSVPIASRLVEAQGANVEVFLSILLLWTFRKHPIAAGFVAALGYLNREFTIYGVLALFVVEFPRARAEAKPFLQKWLVGTVVAGATGWTLLRLTPWSLNYFASSAPAPILQPLYEIVTNWKYFFGVLVPNLFGAESQPLSAFNIVSAVQSGSLLAGIALIAAIGVALVLLGRESTRAMTGEASKFPLYLMLTGLLSALGFLLFRNGVRDLMCIRYVLLVLLFPIGLFGLAFQTSSARRLLPLMAGSIGVWALCNTAGHLKLWKEYLSTPPTDEIQLLKETLSKLNLNCGNAPYWTAYPLAFYGIPSLTVASSSAVRIPEYQTAEQACSSPKFNINEHPACENGVRVSRWYICRG